MGHHRWVTDRADLRLRPVRLDDEDICLAAHAVMAADHFRFLIDHEPGEPWADFVQRLENRRRGVDLPDDRVAGVFLLVEVQGAVIGRTSVRFELNDYLASYGGHLGYGILPPFRHRGHTTEVLAQSLVIARANGVGRVLVTCDHDNIGSAMVIERNGGVFESTVDDPSDGIAKHRYWIG